MIGVTPRAVFSLYDARMMNRCTRFFTALSLALLLLLNANATVLAQEAIPVVSSTQKTQQTEVIVFVRNGCKHCQDEEAFLSNLTAQRPDVKTTYLRLENPTDKKRWDEFTIKHGISKVTPLTIIGNQLIIGFDRATTTGQQIIQYIDAAKRNGVATDLSTVSRDLSANTDATCPEDGSTPCTVEGAPLPVTLPVIGTINANAYPLTVLSALLGFIDGFNPCAMWVLVTFLLILLQVGDRKKMVLFAGMFIVAETIMYYLILTVWFKTWDFVQLDTIVTPIVGIVAVGAGIFFLREWRQKTVGCKVTNLDQRQKIRKKIENLALSKFSLFTLLGILGIAFSVNIIEFACSIGIPQTFTKILEMNNLGFWQSNLFLLIYIFFYMIDDFIVFGIGLYGMDKLSLTTKYSKASNLIGGILMILLGLVLILKPSVFLF